MFGDVVELAEAVEGAGGEFKVMLFEELAQGGLAVFLYLAGVAAQDGHDFGFRLGGGGEVDPRWGDMLRL